MMAITITPLGRADPPHAPNPPKPQATAEAAARETAANAQALADVGEKVVISSPPETGNPAAPAPPGGKAKERSPEEALTERIGELNEQMRRRATQVQFAIDDETENVIVRVLNKETGEVIRQIPPEEVLNLAKALEDLRGLMLSSVS